MKIKKRRNKKKKPLFSQGDETEEKEENAKWY